MGKHMKFFYAQILIITSMKKILFVISSQALNKLSECLDDLVDVSDISRGDHDDDDYEHSEDCDHDAFDIEIDDSDEKPEDRA